MAEKTEFKTVETSQEDPPEFVAYKSEILGALHYGEVGNTGSFEEVVS